MGYDTSLKTILLFLIAVNVSLYWISVSQVLPVNFSDPDNPDSPVTDPSALTTQIIALDLSTGNIALGGTFLVVGLIISQIAGNLVLGGTVAVGLFAITLLSPLVSWILFGLPKFMAIMGVPIFISAGVMAFVSVPLFFTVLSFVAQRPVEGHG